MKEAFLYGVVDLPTRSGLGLIAYLPIQDTVTNEAEQMNFDDWDQNLPGPN